MPVRIRLARHGTRNNPFYHLVAITSKAARNARPIEKLGEYDPIPRAPDSIDRPVQAWQHVSLTETTVPTLTRQQLEQPIFRSGLPPATVKKEKRIEWNVERIRYWLSVGAQPSKPVARLLDRAGLIPEGMWFKGMYRTAEEHEKARLEKDAARKAKRRGSDVIETAEATTSSTSTPAP